MSQIYLAGAIGTTRYVIHNIEHGITRVSADQLLRIADALDCPVEALLVPLDAPIPRASFRGRP